MNNRSNFPNYQHYYQAPPQSYSGNANQSWNGWNEQQQHYGSYPRNNYSQPPPPLPPPNSATPRPETRPQTFYAPQNHPSPNNRYYQPQRYSSPNASSGPQNWQRNYYGGHKRQNSESSDNYEIKNKPNKKKKKPLSQNKPSKKNWTLEEAKQALDAEKEYNKRTKNQLMIRFPDLDLNRDIVSKFHTAIENVHFQQSSMPRYCYVTIDENVDIEEVIKDLNKTPFGDGFLKAEYKKDREEDHNVDPKDIDPLTLYVGNLAQEVTKEDVVKAYPKQRRIDIGYAKKMKYTRYAFVSFKNIQDSIEAFINTHSTEMYSKSLIVRFRRLHGTVGMPGESKPQNEPRSLNSDEESVDKESFNLSQTNSVEQNSIPPSTDDAQVDLNLVKKEPCSDDESSVMNTEILDCINETFANHKPMIKTENEVKIKREMIDEDFTKSIWSDEKVVDTSLVKSEVFDENCVKKEIDDGADKKYSDDDDDDVEEDEDNNFDNLLNSLKDRASKGRSIQNLFP